MNEKTSVKSTWDSSKTIKAIFAGSLAAFIVTLFINIIIAMLLVKVDLFGDALVILSMIICALSSFIGSISTAKMLKKNGLLVGVLSSTCYYLVMLIFGLFSSGFSFTMNSLVKLAVVLISGMFGGILGVNMRKKRK